MGRPVYISLIIAGLIVVPVTSHAADPEKVRELLDVMHMPEVIEGIQSTLLPQLIKMLTEAMKQTHPHLPPDAPEIVSDAVREMIKPMVPDILVMDQKIFSDSLTDQEIEAATEFYRTSAGQSFLKQMPKVSQSGEPPTLTEEDRVTALTFFNSPVGRSLQAKLPAMMQQFDQATQTWMTNHAGQFDRRFDQLLHRRHPEMGIK